MSSSSNAPTSSGTTTKTSNPSNHSKSNGKSHSVDSDHSKMGASYLPQPPQQPSQHSCEICGASGLSDDLMRDHTRTCHVEGSSLCPFCGLTGVVPAEMLLHVNQAHLDYLTPENELMSFIDDQTPSVDGDSDSMSECRGLSPSITELPGIVNNHNYHNSNGCNNSTPSNTLNNLNISSTSNNLNSSSKPVTNGFKPPLTTAASTTSTGATARVNGAGPSHFKYKSSSTSGSMQSVSFGGYGSSKSNGTSGSQMTMSMSSSISSTCSSLLSNNSGGSKVAQDRTPPHDNDNNNLSDDKNCDMNGFKAELPSQTNGFGNGGETAGAGQKHGQGSPLRSQLGLKLKTNKPKLSAGTSGGLTVLTNGTANGCSKGSPLMCLLCPYTADNPNVLEEHINRSHFDPLSPSVNGANQKPSQNSRNISSNQASALTQSANACPICVRCFDSCADLELHVNIEHRDILSPAKVDHNGDSNGLTANGGDTGFSLCPVCGISFGSMKTQEMELHIEKHFAKSPGVQVGSVELEKQAQKLREQREFEILRAQYGMDNQGNFREQSAAAMQRAVYAGEMSVADYYERQVGLRAAESNGVDDGSSCTKSVAARVVSLSAAIASGPGTKTYVCSGVDHYASSYGDKGWGCGYRNLQMMLSSLLQNTAYNEALYSAWGSNGPARSAMPSISRLQKMVEAAWAQGFDVQGKEQLGCKLYNTRKWIGATEIVTVLSWLRLQCTLVDFHRPTSSDGRHPELFNWVKNYFDEPRIHTPPLYLQHQGHSRTIIGIEQKATGQTLLVLDPSHGPRQVAALGSNQDSLRLIRRGPNAMKAPQYQIVCVRGLIEKEEEYQASKVMVSKRIPPD